MRYSIPTVRSEEWSDVLASLPTPLARPLDLYATAPGDDRLRWVACRSFCAACLSLLHGLGLAACAGVQASRPPRSPSSPFPRFRERMHWLDPRAILHAWALANPALPRPARMPLDCVRDFPELSRYAVRCRTKPPTHAVEALALLSRMAKDTLGSTHGPAGSGEWAAAADALLARLVLRDLRFLGQWALSAPLPVAPDQTSVEGDEALILRGVAPRRDVVPAGACGAPGQGVVAAPVGGGPVLALHPFCLFDSAPVLGRLPEPSDAGACRWPSVQLLTRATDTPLYRCSASGELVSRSELADSVAAALAPAVAPGRALSTRWGLLWIGIRQTRKLNDACGHDVVDRILIAMDRAASAWDATHGDVWGKGPFAFPFWRHGDELAIPFLSDNSCDPFPAVCSAAAHVVAAATHEAMQCGLGMHWPTSEAARESHAPSPGPLRVFVGFTLDAGVVQGSCQPLAHRMMAELAEIRDAERACGEACENGPPLLWIGRSNTRAPWRMQATPVFARVSEASFAILRNAASPGDWLLRRNRHRGIGNLVGGHLEDMDANDGCALVRREIREELGLSVRARELAPLGDAPATAIEFSDRAKCMTYYILRFFQASLPPDRFGETACSAHHCHWEPAQRIVSQSAPSAVARFPARLLTAAATGSPGLRTAASLDDWRPLSDVMDEHSRSLPAQQPPAPVAGNQPEPPPPPPKR